jgi:hypothetical protein
MELHVPRYFFDIRDGENLFVDEEGLSFPDFESAQREAAEAAASSSLAAEPAASFALRGFDKTGTTNGTVKQVGGCLNRTHSGSSRRGAPMPPLCKAP